MTDTPDPSAPDEMLDEALEESYPASDPISPGRWPSDALLPARHNLRAPADGFDCVRGNVGGPGA